jgi:uncharacterized membrane protein
MHQFKACTAPNRASLRHPYNRQRFVFPRRYPLLVLRNRIRNLTSVAGAPPMNRFLVLIHLLAVIVWIGGMFFAHVCLRPVAAAQLQPPQRLPLLAAILGRFFVAVGWALVLLWGSGLARFAQAGTAVPWNWHVMLGIATVMTVILGAIVFRFHRPMVAAVAAQDWPKAGAAMNAIRKLVLVNLALGFVTVAVAILGA